jgi:DNA modification methylase
MRARRGFRDRIVELRRVRAGDLSSHPRAWRRHPPRKRSALRSLLRSVGWAEAVIATPNSDGSLTLIDGHLRASLDPQAMIPVLVLDVSAAEAETLLATLDPLAALIEPDPEVLAPLLERIQASNGAVVDLLRAVARSAGLPVAPLSGDPEEAPEFPHEPRTSPGDLWTLGEHRLLCGDSRSPEHLARLMQGARADVLWTDPPYGVSYTGRTRRALRIQNDRPSGLEHLLAEAFAAIDAVLRPGAALYVAHPAGALSVVFASRFLAQGWRLHQGLVWVKDAPVLGHADYHYQHEPILYGYKPGPGRWGRGGKGWYGGNDQTSVLHIPRPKASREHPTAKPVELIRRCLANSSDGGDAVLDPFLGSGSTLIACEMLGRRFFGMELDPRYCDVAVNRWQDRTGRRARRLRGRFPRSGSEA